MYNMFTQRVFMPLFLGFLICFPISAGAQQTFALVADLPSNQPVGTTITFNVVGPAVNQDYRLDIAKAGVRARPVYGYTLRRQFQWTPYEEGEYTVIATVRDLVTRERQIIRKRFFVRPVAADVPIVSATRNPLVALYSAPPCQISRRMRVAFVPVEGGQTVLTAAKACNSTLTMNFLVAGMREDTAYEIRHSILDQFGQVLGTGPLRIFTTGVPSIALPAVTVRVPPTAQSSTAEPIVLAAPTFGGPPPFASDTGGNIVWYYDNPVETNIDVLMTRLSPQGTMLMLIRTPDADRFRMRQIDLAGNTLRETTVRWLSEQYRALGGTDVIPALHHEARLLPNGQYILLGTIERLLEDVQGPGVVNVIGDIVLSLDSDWNLTWAWNSFDHMDVTRLALQGETCLSNAPGCPIVLFSEEANDWLHANAIGYSPADGNLILSIRHQDWVTKIDYQNGNGLGSVLWNLGNEGHFALKNPDPSLWFTHQHDPGYIADNTIILYDNGNGNPDCLADENACVSRGQVYTLDETTMNAELVENFDLQNYSRAVGAAQKLANGNLAFNSGIVDGGGTARADELNSDGTIVFSLETDTRIYRSFRLRNLYTPPPAAGLPAPAE